jgi:hypothetical protein
MPIVFTLTISSVFSLPIFPVLHNFKQMLQVRKNESRGAVEKKTRFRMTISKTTAEGNKRNYMPKTTGKTDAEDSKQNRCRRQQAKPHGKDNKQN